MRQISQFLTVQISLVGAGLLMTLRKYVHMSPGIEVYLLGESPR